MNYEWDRWWKIQVVYGIMWNVIGTVTAKCTGNRWETVEGIDFSGCRGRW